MNTSDTPISAYGLFMDGGWVEAEAKSCRYSDWLRVFIRFKHEAEAIKITNESEYSLAGVVWTKDIDNAFGVAQDVGTGTRWVNTFVETPNGLPLGGYKKSGCGREVAQDGS